MLSDFISNTRSELSLDNLSEANTARASYFTRTPHPFFEALGRIFEECGQDWSFAAGTAVHVDLAACVTTTSWGNLPTAVAEAIRGNCSVHLNRTLQALPSDAVLLCDGKSACNAVAGAGGPWELLCQFTEQGRIKSVRVKRGVAGNQGVERQFFAWNYPANRLPADMLNKVAEWVRTSLHE